MIDCIVLFQATAQRMRNDATGWCKKIAQSFYTLRHTINSLRRCASVAPSRETKPYTIYATAFFTSAAASLSRMADWTFNPLSPISFCASMALVPCRRTMIGTLMVPMEW